MNHPSYPVQKLFLDTYRNVYFLEQDISESGPDYLKYNRDGSVYTVHITQYEKVGDSMEHTLSADKYSIFELKMIDRSYPGVGERYFVARELQKKSTANVGQLKRDFFEIVMLTNYKR